MDVLQYQLNVLARASNTFHNDKVPDTDLIKALYGARSILRQLDPIKKALFYGKSMVFSTASAEFDYETRCKTGPVRELSSQDVQLLHGVLGIATELEELLVQLLSHIDMGEPLDIVNVQEELGDHLWYIALAANAVGMTLPDLMRQNDAKLEKRFGPVFSEDKALNRDLDAERKTLEGQDDE